MSTITLKISASNNHTYPQIILRKFFNMIFISEDGKKLNIYTATVFGGVAASTQETDSSGTAEQKTAIPVASYAKDNGGMRCALSFKYEGDIISKAGITVTDKTKSLWEQADCMKQVWESCDKISTQEEVTNLFSRVYPDIKTPLLDMFVEGPIYHIYESGKKGHECIAAAGVCELPSPPSSEYQISSNPNMEWDGMEFMNWVKTELTLTDNILNKIVHFNIELEQNELYYTPDFTWYFAPPPGYNVDENSAVVKIKQELKRNFVQSVADDTTVHFYEWENDEEIDNRQKARVYISPQTSEDPYILSKSQGIQATLKIINPQQSGNKQFLLGLLVGFILSYCSDKTRLNDYYECIKKICTCPPNACSCKQLSNALGFVFPALAITTYLSIIFKVEKCVSPKRTKLKKFFKVTKWISGIATVLVLLYVFFAWLVFPDIMEKLIPSCTANNRIIWGLSISGLILNLGYIFFCTVRRKKKIYNFL